MCSVVPIDEPCPSAEAPPAARAKDDEMNAYTVDFLARDRQAALHREADLERRARAFRLSHPTQTIVDRLVARLRHVGRVDRPVVTTDASSAA